MPPTSDRSRDLLFGLLALQTGLINQAQLVAAFHAWTQARERSMAEILAEQGAISAACVTLVEGLVIEHLRRHDNDPERSLVAIGIGRSTRECLAHIGDPELDASLAQVAPGSTEHDADPDRTATYSVGIATGGGLRFQILRPHARGGLGALFIARDTELNREVALKQILEDHADDQGSRARFVLEAEITGGLEHPGIVPVYGLGTYPDGRPFYAMRFVRGESFKAAIASFRADPALKRNPGAQSLALRKLLRRFLDLCNAIDYAHSRGVLHRDIKPANVILGKYGETLVVDWGLAKAVGRAQPAAASEERTLVPTLSSGSSETLPGAVLGTPAFMSPEQAAGDLEHLGPRSDVYSLGATLYYLLTGEPPVVHDDVGTALQAVQTGDYRPPRQVDRAIDPALEAVCLKAMALRAEDRYPTARALAEDIDRWMADEPVTARKEPFVESVRRWMRRRRTAVTAGGAALAAGVLGLAAVLAVQARANVDLRAKNGELTAANARVQSANVDLLDANERVRQQFNLAMDAIELYHGDVSKELLLKERQFAGLRERLLRGAAEFYGKLEQRLEGQQDLESRRALGRAYFALGNLTYDIGKHSEAAAIHHKGLAVRRELLGRPGADAETTLDVVRSLIRLGNSMVDIHDLAARSAPFEEALRLAEQMVAAGAGSDEARAVLADCLLNLAEVIWTGPEQGSALALARRARVILRELVAKDPSHPRYLELLSQCHLTIGYQLNRTGKPAEAIVSEKEGLSIYEKLADARPDSYDLKDKLAKFHYNIAASLERLGRRDEAIASLRRAIAIWQRTAEANPAVIAVANNLAFGFNGLGHLLIAVGRPTEALEALAPSQPILRRLADADPGRSSHQNNLAFNFTRTGQALARLGMWSEAREAFAGAMTIVQKRIDEHPAEKRYRRDLAGILSDFGGSLRKAGRAADAVAAFDRAKEIQQRLAAGPASAADRDALAVCESNAAAALLSLGRLSEARACCDRAIAIFGDLVKGDPKNDDHARGLAASLLRSGSIRVAAGDLAGGAADWRRALALYASHLPEGEGAIFQACCHGALAGLAAKDGAGVSTAEGESQAEQALAVLQRVSATGYRDNDLLRVETGFDPLRSRPDFQLLMMDLAMPHNPFTR
jgi:serine/threonine-protein kinase